MRRTILYYPHIIPNDDWIRKSLFYWDEISSIVPDAWFRREGLTYDLEYLYSENLFRPVNPQDILYSDGIDDFEKESISRIRSYLNTMKNYSGKRIDRSSERSSIHIDKINFELIHTGKTTTKILDFLKQNKEIINYDGEWISVEGKLSFLYMSILAKHLALMDSRHMVVGTGSHAYERLSYPTSRPNYNNMKPFLVQRLLDIIPVPSPHVTLKQIVDFKKTYNLELLHFRSKVNEFEQKLSKSDSIIEIKENTVLFKETIERETEQLARMMKGMNILYHLSSLKTIINPTSPALLTLIGGALGSKYLNISLPLTLLGSGVMGAIQIGQNYMMYRQNTQEKLADNGFSYMYYARQKNIIG
jgi:hypothetical protein